MFAIIHHEQVPNLKIHPVSRGREVTAIKQEKLNHHVISAKGPDRKESNHHVTNAGGSSGNPYHDNLGRFSSK